MAPPSSFDAVFRKPLFPGGKETSRKQDGAMSLCTGLPQAAGPWRSDRSGLKTVRNACITVQQLDYRQLLNINFMRNVVIGFPATQVPGVVFRSDNLEPDNNGNSETVNPAMAD
jgi:hypothetical protein